jgi:hypothetical protein
MRLAQHAPHINHHQRKQQRETVNPFDETLIPADQVKTIYFGPSWTRHLYRARRVDTPLGQDCYLCEEPIIENDRGLIKAVARMGDDGQPYGAIKPVHIECDALPIIGHTVDICPCTGYPPNRDTAKLAWQRAQLDGMHP